MKKICLINPPQTFLFNPRSYPPLGLLYIAAALEAQGFEVILHNEPDKNFEDQKWDIPHADIYGITSTTATLYEVRKIVAFLKERNPESIVTVGGIHATVDPKETMQITGADFVFDGEGEKIFPAFCLDPGDFYLLNSRIIHCPRIYDLDSLGMPARHLLDIDILQDKSGIHLSGEFEENDFATTIITSRGCPFRCAFCCKTRITEGVRYRSPSSIFEELKYLRDTYNIHQFRIVDDAFTVDRFRCQDLMMMTAGEQMYFTTILRADSIVNKQMLITMKMGGVRIVSIGVESANQGILDIINKREKIEEIKQVIKWCHEIDLKVKVFVIFGLPGETLETIEETKRFFKEMKPDAYTLSSFTPLPGSDIYRNPSHYGLIPKYKKGDYHDFFFYYEPKDIDKGFHFETPLKIREARGELIRFLRSGCWR